MRNTLETRLGIFVALAVIAAVLILEVVGGTEHFQRGYRLKALFSSVQDLKVGDRVKMGGVEIGRVEDIQISKRAPGKVEVTLKMRKTAEVRTDSVATVKFIGLMGQNFVNLEFGSPTAPKLEPGQDVATEEQPDLGALVARLDKVAGGVENLTKSFTGEKIDNLLGPFTDFLRANKGPLTTMIANMQAISGQVASGRGSVGKMIYDESLYGATYATVTNLQATSDEVKLAINDVRRTLGNVNKVADQVTSGQGTVGKLLNDDAFYREATASMTNLREILQKINEGKGSVGPLVNDREFYNNAKMTLQKLDKATEGLEDQGPLSVIGLLVNNLF
jgi:phospholipid/cholesterol/gamma-HCH transport system substrate-binding protein